MAFKMTLGEKIFQAINLFLLALVTLAFLIPFLAIVGTSFASASELARRGNFILIPYRPVLYTYRVILGKGSMVYSAFRVTFTRVLLGTTLNLAFTFPLAYVLSKKRLLGRNAMVTYVFITMLIGGGLVPNFVLVEKLGLLNTMWALILPGMINPWWMLIMRNFLMSIPEELEEAALVDGASPPTILLRIVLPLSMPIIATIGLWYAVQHWNAWFDALIYLFDPKKLPLQPILRSILARGAGDYSEYGDFAKMIEEDLELPPTEALKAGMIMVTTVPILLVYPFIQRYFVKGVMVGGVKG